MGVGQTFDDESRQSTNHNGCDEITVEARKKVVHWY
jgi:hypothetical protein